MLQKQIAKYLFVKYLAKSQVANSIVFDIGCGTGFLMQNIFRYHKKYNLNKIKTFYAVDKSVNMCQIMQQIAAKMTLKMKKKLCTNFVVYNKSYADFKIKNYDRKQSSILYSSMAFQWMSDVDLAIKKSMMLSRRLCILLPLSDSFINIKQFVTQKQADELFYKLPTVDEIKQICLKYGLKCNFVSKKYEYLSLLDFFKSIKNIGANVKESLHEEQNLHTIKFLLQKITQRPFVSSWKLAVITN